jgi:hypothetical protein
MARNQRIFIGVLIVVLVAAAFFGYYETTSSVAGDTLAQCVITGVGGFQLRIVSDSTGAPVSGAKISAVNNLGCDGETQVVHLNSFSTGQAGWLAPVFPSQATPAGELNFTVMYQGGTYRSSSFVAYAGYSCVTLHVPSGNVTTTTEMNGAGSYCWQ